jgi:regulator of protease activity HflC (stomatin/prohibitin superfamily)
MRNSMQSSGGGGGGGAFKKLGLVAAGLVVAILLVRPTIAYIEPGHVGIVINRAGGGVDPKPLGPGFHLRNPLFTAIQEYPTFMQTLVLTRESTDGSPNNDEINVNSIEGQPLSLDVSMSFELEGRDGHAYAGGAAEAARPVRHCRTAVHPQRVPRAQGGHGRHLAQERHVATGAHRPERTAEEHLPGAG